jgi:hypothetical protein
MCPCCGFCGLALPPYKNAPANCLIRGFEPPYCVRFGFPSYDVCECCGYEYGNDDEPGNGLRGFSFEEYLENWMKEGCIWFDPDLRPINWTIEEQRKDKKVLTPGDWNNGKAHV